MGKQPELSGLGRLHGSDPDLQGFGMKVVAYDLYPDENMPGSRDLRYGFNWMSVCIEGRHDSLHVP